MFIAKYSLLNWVVHASVIEKMDLEPTTAALKNCGKGKQISPPISATHGTVSQVVLVLLDSSFCERVMHEVKRLKPKQRR